MTKVSFDDLLEAGVHFGHLKRKWNPNMAPYIFMERNGIHIIDLYKTQAKLEEAQNALKQIAKSGKRILFVATKKQAKELVAELVKKVNMPYVTERWPGGMLTNFATIRKAVRKMSSIDKMANTNTYKNLSKREKLQISRERAKLEKNLGSIADMSRLPAALFVVDINKEKIAVAEARKLNIPIFAMVDTNTDPTLIDFPIPANDDASKSISIIVNAAVLAIAEGLNERKLAREKEVEEAEEAKQVMEDLKAKSEALAIAEEEADIEAEKGKKGAKAKKAEGEEEKPAKPKRPRKTVVKKK
ncbi:MAG: 30S ribosomal protein S2 [Bacteroidetes bacterium]|nr:MAG: 30S ribosomal protein S2 [Bacteroidota bacterium]RLD70450.1 MAG: 30S ribosomal protein S2 [Bacteroidota bacterium]RLD83395.1 MAG: 30S ribosomal protein S2 [Bacteroidota bacterium]